ncbi:MAG: dockerin type I domain-containing protein [Acidobacteriota bacterium]
MTGLTASVRDRCFPFRAAWLVLSTLLLAPVAFATSLDLDGTDVAWSGACVDLVLTTASIEPGTEARLIARLSDGTSPENPEFHLGHGCTEQVRSIFPPPNGELALSYRASEIDVHRLIVAIDDSLFGEHFVQLTKDGFDPADLAHQALVIYNVNAPHAETLARDYVNARDLLDTRVCGVQLPTGQFASADELLGAREQAVQCLCDTIEAEILFECETKNLEQIVDLSPVTHLVLIRGIPPRLTGTTWGSDHEEPSFDYYFSYHLTHVDSILSSGNGSVSPSYLRNGAVHGYLGPLDPAAHGAMAYGRVEAYDLGRTRNQLERTLAAEADGVQGNILTEHDLDGFTQEVSVAARNLTSSFDEKCTAYLTHEPFIFGDPESSWNHLACRWGSTGSDSTGSIFGKLPGATNTTIPKAIDAGMLFGSYPFPNGQAGFNNFNTMIRWRKTDEDCEPLCEDLPTPALIEQCQRESDDLFQDLNSDCVGFAPGFIGHQIRSYPVQFYGFRPPGWSMPSSGAIEKTPPVILTERRSRTPSTGPVIGDGGLVIALTNRYAHYGVHSKNDLDDSVCTHDDGSIVSCPERIAVRLDKALAQNPALPVSGSREIQVSFKYRNQASPGGQFQFSLHLLNEGTGTGVWKHFTVDMDDQHLSWTSATRTFTVTEAQVDGEITLVTARLRSVLSWDLIGFFDLDEVRIVDVPTGDQLLDTAIGDFDNDNRNTTVGGDWASNVIDRMGGIACWGSSSHHLTGGWAFNPSKEIAGAFFGGRSLGESLVFGNAKSGIVYGDPLYRPLAIKIWHPEGIQVGKPDELRIWSDSPEDPSLRLNVLHGTSNRDSVDWTLSSCEVATVEECEPGTGTVVLSGVGAIEGLSLSLADILPANFDGVLRLTAVNAGEEERTVSNYAFVEWYDHPRPPCPWDLNGDEVVGDADLRLLIPYLPCSADDLTADLDGDGDVDGDDNTILRQYYRDMDPRGDLNGDGVIDMADFDYLEARLCNRPNPPPEYDLNGDGLITEKDVEILVDNFGDCPT